MRRRPIACVLLLCYLPACTTWRVQQGVTPKQVIDARQPTAVRLTLPDNARVIVQQPRIVAGDSIAGLLNGVLWSVAVSDVAQVAIREPDSEKTILLGVGGAVVFGILALWAITRTVGDAFDDIFGTRS